MVETINCLCHWQLIVAHDALVQVGQLSRIIDDRPSLLMDFANRSNHWFSVAKNVCANMASIRHIGFT